MKNEEGICWQTDWQTDRQTDIGDCRVTFATEKLEMFHPYYFSILDGDIFFNFFNILSGIDSNFIAEYFDFVDWVISNPWKLLIPIQDEVKSVNFHCNLWQQIENAKNLSLFNSKLRFMFQNIHLLAKFFCTAVSKFLYIKALYDLIFTYLYLQMLEK